MPDLVEVASGLAFPEGPIAMPDGTVVLVEMFGPRLTRVRPDGSKETIADVPGGPNGAAMGPGGLIYLCNNGGRFTEADMDGLTFPGGCTMANYLGGRIQTVDPATGKVEDLYTECNGNPLWAPNDLVFDAHGGFYFTDHGMVDDAARIHHLSGIYYAQADGSAITELVFPADDPNGIGLSPDGTTLYWAETWRGRIMQRTVLGPGQLSEPGLVDTSQCLYGFPGFQLLDSLAVDSDGNVCVATIVNGGVSVVSPAGELVDFVETGDLITTNVCFGGDDLSTAYITLSTTGRLVKTAWPRPGAKLHHLNE
ncbi:MAG: SMP-30/gluconolactonase/LRE family protein [Ilumatobacteraceae bacterium]